MKTGNDAVANVVDTLCDLGIEFFLAGSYSSNFYGIPRATRHADFVAVFSVPLEKLAHGLGDEFILDPQVSFEGVTGTMRDIFSVPSIAFKIEIFHLSNDPHDQSRFARRRKAFDELVDRELFIPTAEDVIVKKLRWERIGQRGKDGNDVRDILAGQGDDAPTGITFTTGRLSTKRVNYWRKSAPRYHRSIDGSDTIADRLSIFQSVSYRFRVPTMVPWLSRICRGVTMSSRPPR